MSELKLVSPLLDQMSVEEEIAGHNGCTCYALRHVQSGERFVVKRISVPASDLQVRALILSGAYPDDAAVHAYYGSVAEDIKNELDTGMRLAENGYFAGASSYHALQLHDGAGLDGVIYGAMPTGMESTIKLRIGDFLLTGVVFGNTAYKIGQEVKFEVGGEDILLFDRKSGKLITAGSLHV